MCCEHELWALFIPLNSRLITGIIILPISKPHINFIVFSLCGKKQLYYLMIKRYEFDRIKPNTVDKLQPVYCTCTRHT